MLLFLACPFLTAFGIGNSRHVVFPARGINRLLTGFYRSYLEAERRGLVFVNPRRNFGKADTLEKALEEKQFRIKNMVSCWGSCFVAGL